MSKQATVCDLKATLSRMSGVPSTSIAIAKPFAYKLAHLKLIPSLKWNEAHFFSDETKKLGTRAGLKFRDGTTIVYKDARPNEMTMVDVRRWFPEKFELDSRMRTIAIDGASATIGELRQLLAARSSLSSDCLSLAVANPRNLTVPNRIPNLRWDAKGTFDDAGRTIESLEPVGGGRLCIVFKDSRKREKRAVKSDPIGGGGVAVSGRRRRPAGGMKIYTPKEILEREREMRALDLNGASKRPKAGVPSDPSKREAPSS